MATSSLLANLNLRTNVFGASPKARKGAATSLLLESHKGSGLISKSHALRHQRGLQGRRTTSGAQDPDSLSSLYPYCPGPLRRQGGPRAAALWLAGDGGKQEAELGFTGSDRGPSGLGERLQKQSGGLGERPS